MKSVLNPIYIGYSSIYLLAQWFDVMLKRKTTVKYHSQVFDYIFNVPYRAVNCYLKRLGPFVEIWCCKKNALSFI